MEVTICIFFIALMYNPFANKSLQKLLLRDIQEFIDLPLVEDKF